MNILINFNYIKMKIFLLIENNYYIIFKHKNDR